ncbi:MAG: methionine adenosyltransferase [Firmicutes bacterium]|nr:methionine adenosyltransferase [Bacillota bacterium]
MRKLITSESVTEGHPDKICDKISDSILDAILAEDPMARVACEVLVSTGLILVTGEITTECYVDIPKIARDTVLDIGYTRAKYGFDGETCSVLSSIKEQSPDIAQGVNKSKDDESTGAGDQGMMYGYATDETEELMPMPIIMAHRLTRQLAKVRKDGTLSYLRPDGKSQVTVEYDDDKVKRIDTVVISTQHDDGIDHDVLEKDIIEKVIKAVLPEDLIDENTVYHINPTGRFVIGGPQGDAGLNGRKLNVDTYGGVGRHCGGAFSGKDPTKVDRSACYAARYVAKNIVASGLAKKCEIQVAYAIGVAKPVSVMVDTFGTGKLADDEIAALVEKHFDLRPVAIINHFDLRRPIYAQTAAYGHFGRTDIDLPWEKTDKAEELAAYLK